MGFEGLSKKPAGIKDSMLSRNIEKLRALGKKGAEVTNTKRDLIASSEEARQEMKKAQAEIEELERILSANEHILSPDGEDMDYSNDNI